MRIVVLISGYGSNLKAIIDYIKFRNLPITISAVISNDPDAYGLIIAKNHNLQTYVIPKDINHNLALLDLLKPIDPNWIILAGFMKILSAQFVNNYKNKILNIHPSLLPKHPGLNTHKKVIINRDQEHGCTVHYVTAELDAGPIIKQSKISVLYTDTELSLKTKVQKLEHELYPKVIESLLYI
jgi:phosphoribosylglycinamide formyltransferase-1